MQQEENWNMSLRRTDVKHHSEDWKNFLKSKPRTKQQQQQLSHATYAEVCYLKMIYYVKKCLD